MVCFAGDYTPIEYFDTGFDNYIGRFAQERMACRRAGPIQHSKDWGDNYTPLHRAVSVEAVDFGDYDF